MILILKHGWNFLRKSTEDKPTEHDYKISNGYILYEVDTYKTYIYADKRWNEYTSQYTSLILAAQHSKIPVIFEVTSSEPKPVKRDKKIENGYGLFEKDTGKMFVYYDGTWYFIDDISDDNIYTKTETDGKISEAKTELNEKINGKIDKYSTMPDASADYYGKIVEFVGETGATYTNAYFYKCTSADAVVSAEATQKSGTGLGTISVDADMFFANVGSEGTYTLKYYSYPSEVLVGVQSGGLMPIMTTLTRDNINDSGDAFCWITSGNNLLYSKDKFGTKFYTDSSFNTEYPITMSIPKTDSETDFYWAFEYGNPIDIAAYGISYTGTAAVDDEIEVSLTIAGTFAWERTDVQTKPEIKSLYLEASQIISQDPITLQMTAAQQAIVEDVNNLQIEVTSDETMGLPKMWIVRSRNYHDGRIIFFNFYYYNGYPSLTVISYNTTTKQATYKDVELVEGN